jgi:hypothetical protein|tara:strand:- start:156 stop:305 length:150 start_codon:yes stop_codon:yes gene_type:complete
MKVFCIGIATGISLVHIFSPETIEAWVAGVFLSLAATIELFAEIRKKKK